MPRIRIMSSTAGAALLLIALVAATQAQGPGGATAPGGGGAGGRGGFGGGPGGGGRGGRGGGGVLGLLDYPAVQTEIDLTDEQKQQIADIKAAIAKKRQALMPARNTNGGNVNAAAAGNGAANPAAVQNGGNAAAAGQAGGAGGQAGGRGGRFQMTPELQAAFQEVREYSDTMNSKILTKVLNKKQTQRLTQIDLQRQGPIAVLQPAIAEKLNISPEQLEEMQGIQQQGRQARRDAMQSAFQANAQNFQTPDGNVDRAAIQAYRQSPAGQAQQETIQKQMTSLEGQTIAAISKVLTKKQKTGFNNMLGKPFDLDKLTPESRVQNAAATPAATKAATKADATAKSDTAATPSKTAAAKKGTSKKNSTKKSARSAAASN